MTDLILIIPAMLVLLAVNLILSFDGKFNAEWFKFAVIALIGELAMSAIVTIMVVAVI